MAVPLLDCWLPLSWSGRWMLSLAHDHARVPSALSRVRPALWTAEGRNTRSSHWAGSPGVAWMTATRRPSDVKPSDTSRSLCLIDGGRRIEKEMDKMRSPDTRTLSALLSPPPSHW